MTLLVVDNDDMTFSMIPDDAPIPARVTDYGEAAMIVSDLASLSDLARDLADLLPDVPIVSLIRTAAKLGRLGYTKAPF